MAILLEHGRFSLCMQIKSNFSEPIPKHQPRACQGPVRVSVVIGIQASRQVIGVDDVEGVDEFAGVRPLEKVAGLKGCEDMPIVGVAESVRFHEVRRWLEPR